VLYGPVEERLITRNGLPLLVNDVDVTLSARGGSLDAHLRIEWLASGPTGHVVGTGTSTVEGGTGSYAGLSGGGRNSATWLPSFDWEGFVYSKP
jgi:hypothetical protein